MIESYLGALKSSIKDVVHGDVSLHCAHVKIDGVLVAILEVPPAAVKPISVQQDFYFYVRTGASNRKVPTDQWRSLLDSAQVDDLLRVRR